MRPPVDDEQLRAFGETIRRTRRARELSQEDLAAAGGVHPNQVRRLERATADVRTSTTLRILAGLGVPFSDVARDYEESLRDDASSAARAVSRSGSARRP